MAIDESRQFKPIAIAVLTVSDVDVLAWTMWLPAIAAFVLSILACRDIGQQPWRVRRRVDRRAGAAPA